MMRDLFTPPPLPTNWKLITLATSSLYAVSEYFVMNIWWGPSRTFRHLPWVIPGTLLSWTNIFFIFLGFVGIAMVSLKTSQRAGVAISSITSRRRAVRWLLSTVRVTVQIGLYFAVAGIIVGGLGRLPFWVRQVSWLLFIQHPAYRVFSFLLGIRNWWRNASEPHHRRGSAIARERTNPLQSLRHYLFGVEKTWDDLYLEVDD